MDLNVQVKADNSIRKPKRKKKKKENLKENRNITYQNLWELEKQF